MSLWSGKRKQWWEKERVWPFPHFLSPVFSFFISCLLFLNFVDPIISEPGTGHRDFSHYYFQFHVCKPSILTLYVEIVLFVCFCDALYLWTIYFKKIEWMFMWCWVKIIIQNQFWAIFQLLRTFGSLQCCESVKANV